LTHTSSIREGNFNILNFINKYNIVEE